MLNGLLARDVKGIVFHASINRFLKGYVYLLKNRLKFRKYGVYKAYIYISKSTSKKLLSSIYYSTLKYCICPSSTIWSARGKLSYTIVYILHEEYYNC